MKSPRNKKISLYKYCTFPRIKDKSKIEEIREIWKSLISNIQFKNIRHLNDPFEGFLSIKDEDGKRIKSISKEMYIASFSRVTPYSLKESTVNKFRNVYMWSHYADSMSGICLKFGLIPQNVRNDIKYKKVVYLGQANGKVTPFLKFKSWRFEREYRMTIRNKITSKEAIYVKCDECGVKLEAVYLGVRLIGKNTKYGAKTLIKKLKENSFVKFLLNELPQEVPIYICVREHNSFRIIKRKENLQKLTKE